MSRRIIICGPSGAGKTTIAEAVGRILNLPVLSMDNFRARKLRYPTVKVGDHEIRTYESPECLDSNAITCKLKALLLTRGGFVAEGNHLLAYPVIATIPGLECYYLDVPFAVSLERRKTRHCFLPADESFALIGEQETARHVVPQLQRPGIVRLDGTLPPEQSVGAILSTVEMIN